MRFFLVFIFLVCSVFAKDDYVLGEGYQVGNLPIYVGGYFSIDYQKKDEQDRYRIDDIAFLSYGGTDTFSYLLELEFKDLYVKTDDNGNKTTTRNEKLYVERMYIDYRINDNYELRLGKYNSPIGFWNLMPINVLRETTSSPISTKIIFPQFTTGLDLAYNTFNEDNEIKVDVIFQNNSTIDDEYNNYDVLKHYALGFSYEKENYVLKVNGGYFSQRSKHDYVYALLSARYDDDNYQFLSEFGAQRSDTKNYNYAGYVQGLYRFTNKHIGIIRLESYDNEFKNIDDSIAIFAYTYRPLYPIAFKTEYQQHTLNNENQLIFSFSVLF